MATVDIDLGAYKLGWSDKEDYVFKPEKGLNEEIIRQIDLDIHTLCVGPHLVLVEAPDLSHVGKRTTGLG